METDFGVFVRFRCTKVKGGIESPHKDSMTHLCVCARVYIVQCLSSLKNVLCLTFLSPPCYFPQSSLASNSQHAAPFHFSSFLHLSPVWVVSTASMNCSFCFCSFLFLSVSLSAFTCVFLLGHVVLLHHVNKKEFFLAVHPQDILLHTMHVFWALLHITPIHTQTHLQYQSKV